jgi:hypothetical protein
MFSSYLSEFDHVRGAAADDDVEFCWFSWLLSIASRSVSTVTDITLCPYKFVSLANTFNVLSRRSLANYTALREICG